jgi:hypothetical protein
MPPVDPYFALRFVLLLAAAFMLLLVVIAAVACMAWIWDHPASWPTRRRIRSKDMERFAELAASGRLDEAEREADKVFHAAGANNGT